MNRFLEKKGEYLEKYITILNILRLFQKNIELVFEKLGYKIREISKNLVADLNKSNLNIKDILEFLWKIVLYNQFHDILPGSSIPEVYIDYEKDLNQIKLFAKILKDICYCSSLKLYLLNEEIKKLMQDKNSLIPIIIFNPLSWTRNEVIELNLGNINKGCIRDLDGNIVSTYIYKDNNNNDNYIAKTFVKNIPPLGFKFLFFDFNCENSINEKNGVNLYEDIKSKNIIIENENLKIEIDKRTGYISKFYLKEENLQLLSSLANRILIFEEKQNSDAWNIDPKYEQNKIEYNEELYELNILEKTPLCCSIEIKRKVSNSLFIQRICLEKYSKILKLSMDIDLKDSHWLIKLDFPTNLKSNNLISEIPYAVIERSISPLTKLDAARWEHSCQKFVAVYDSEKNISCLLANNGKYGVNSKLNEKGLVIIRPTIVRSAIFTLYAKETIFVNRSPDGKLDSKMPKFTDLECHKDIKFYLMFGRGTIFDNNSWKMAYELNFPITELIDLNWNNKYQLLKNLINNEIINVENTIKSLNLNGFLIISHKNIQIGALKIFENEDLMSEDFSFIIRIIERSGIELQNASIEFNLPSNLKIFKIEEVNLLELPIEDKSFSNIIHLNNNKIYFSIKPFEIKTLKIIILKI